MASDPADAAAANADVAQRLRQLQMRFVAGLAPRRAELTAAWDAGAAQTLRGLLHRLAGAAGAYGYAAMGEQARALELQLGADEAMLSSLTAPFTRLLALMDDAISAGGTDPGHASQPNAPLAQTDGPQR
ncbi:Hpt domain-containing protein [Cupriavidus basilensis]|uniref:Hpt domain-containing protein n=1 Tax=Cupriavidus basilensis TaxID=68895 RepID=UPI002840D6D4|nr:Hpt domain-containing protein [Cupriavidus basilensis]MDR3384629.1 Hpt domain-containing protein [Cupriavidus basilensis]